MTFPENFPKLSGAASAPAIFDEHWWFDAACPGAWDVREIYRDNKLMASFAFSTAKKFGFRYVQMPGLTRTLEPKIFPPGEKAVSQLQNRVSLLAELIGALPKFDRFELCLPPESALGLPFTLLGYANTATYTYRSDLHPDKDEWFEMEQKTRNVVKSAQKNATIEFHADLDRFISLSKRLRKLSAQDRNDYDTITRLFEAAAKRQQACVVSCVNDARNDIASAILIWDSNIMYYWLSARDPAAANSGANSLLIWKAKDFARTKGCRLDLDGFITPQNGLYLAKFGFKPVMRAYVCNVNSAWSGLYHLRSMFKPQISEISYR